MNTVALVDDHPLFRVGLKGILSGSGVDVIGEALDIAGARALVRTMRPTVLVMDVSLPDGDGIAAAAEIARECPHTRVLMLSMHSNEYFVTRALASGVAGYAFKHQALDEICHAVVAVARGERYVPPRFKQHLSAASGSVSSTAFDELSKREREVFHLILAGHTNERIGTNLFISVKTVETHRSHINRKLSVHSTGELIRLAAMHGLLTPAAQPASDHGSAALSSLPSDRT